MKKKKDVLAIITMLCMCVTTLSGVLSMNFGYSHDFINQYGHTVKIFGYGIYANDSYFKAPISIGTDFCILLVLLPLFLYTYLQYRKKGDTIFEIKLISVYAVAFYYGASIAFGVTYNQIFLVYVLLGVLLKLCIIVGIMVIPQTICQSLSGVELPLPVLATKVLSFVALGGFAFYFNNRAYQQLEV